MMQHRGHVAALAAQQQGMLEIVDGINPEHSAQYIQNEGGE